MVTNSEMRNDPAERSPGRFGGWRRRVLVVDDNRDLAESLGELLAAEGFEVRLALDGPAALAAAEDFEPQVIFLDVGLPVMDGYQVAARLRRRRSGVAARLVALTGHGTDQDRRRALNAGFDRHLVKPIGLELLLAVAAGVDRTG